MGRLQEPLTGGLVTMKPANKLEPGQLANMQNAYIDAKSGELKRAPGRTAFGWVSAASTTAEPVGLKDIQFDNGNHYIITHFATAYTSAAVGDTGTFGVLSNALSSGTSLDAIQYRNRFFLLNGSIPASAASALPTNVIVYLSATSTNCTPTTGQHGMAPVGWAPEVTTVAGTFSQTVTGYYEYWTTEVWKYKQDDVETFIESAFSGSKPTTVYVPTTATVPVIKMPALANPTVANRWRVYRSPMKAKESDKKFPSGFMIADLATGSATVQDTTVVVTATALPATANIGTTFYADFGNAMELTGIGGGSASAVVAGLGSKAQGVHQFNFGGLSGSLCGIEVGIRASASSRVNGVVTVGRGRKTSGAYFDSIYQAFLNTARSHLSSKAFVITAVGGAGQTITLGSSTDKWFPPNTSNQLNDSDLNSPDFMVLIELRNSSGLTVTAAVDYVSVTAHYNGTQDSVIPFPTVAYTFGDIISQVSKNGTPPSASTGDLFEDCLVLNDVTNQALLKWSYPGSPEAFPETYYLDFETRDNDRITNIKVVNGRLVVFLDTRAYRVNYLPSERDASFDRGKATEVISSNIGCVNESCAAVFSMSDGTEMLAFVSDLGIHATDGFKVVNMTDDLQWSGIMSRTSTSTPIALVNDRDNECLRYYYYNASLAAGYQYKELRVSYAKDSFGRCSGLVNMANYGSSERSTLRSAWPVRRSSGNTEIYLGYGSATAAGGGKVYRENGNSIPAEDDKMSYQTRIIYPEGMGEEVRLDKLYGMIGNFTGQTPTMSYQLRTYKTNATTADGGVKYATAQAASPKMHGVHFAQMLEGVQVSSIITGSAVGFTDLVIDYTGFGDEDSGK